MRITVAALAAEQMKAVRLSVGHPYVSGVRSGAVDGQAFDTFGEPLTAEISQLTVGVGGIGVIEITAYIVHGDRFNRLRVDPATRRENRPRPAANPSTAGKVAL